MAPAAAAPLALAALLLLGVSAPSAAGAWQATAEDAETVLIAELAGSTRADRPHRLDAALRPIYAALPKTASGRLAPAGARSFLDRAFAQRAGWTLKGLVPEGGAEEQAAPAYLLKLVEDRAGDRGLGLPELAAVAASVEALARKETRARLEAAYGAAGLPLAGRSVRAEVLRALRLHAGAYLGGNASGASEEWPRHWETEAWRPEGGDLSFAEALRLALAMERRFGALRSQACEGPAAAAEGPACLEVSSLYSLCCRGRGPAPEPPVSVLAATWEDFPELWAFSLACLLVAATVAAGGRVYSCHAAAEDVPEAEAEAEAEATADAAAPAAVEAAAAEPGAEGPGRMRSAGMLVLCLSGCGAAASAGLLDVGVLALALAAGLALLAVARLAPGKPKAKKC